MRNLTGEMRYSSTEFPSYGSMFDLWGSRWSTLALTKSTIFYKVVNFFRWLFKRRWARVILPSGYKLRCQKQHFNHGSTSKLFMQTGRNHTSQRTSNKELPNSAETVDPFAHIDGSETVENSATASRSVLADAIDNHHIPVIGRCPSLRSFWLTS